jgi:hypothetical protein
MHIPTFTCMHPFIYISFYLIINLSDENTCITSEYQCVILEHFKIYFQLNLYKDAIPVDHRDCMCITKCMHIDLIMTAVNR